MQLGLLRLPQVLKICRLSLDFGCDVNRASGLCTTAAVPATKATVLQVLQGVLWALSAN